MIIIKVKGRLGNQMFDYALLRKLESMGKDVRLDFSQLYIDGIKNELNIFTNLKYTEANINDVCRLGDCKKDFFSKARRKCGFRKKTHLYEENMMFMNNIFELDEVYLEGFWQSEKYFPDMRKKLLTEFTFDNVDELNKDVINQIKTTNSVSLHVRRGDYTEKKYAGIYGGICTKNYYENALTYLKSRYKDIVVFIFSDDLQWAAQNFKGENCVLVKENTGNRSHLDMYLMSQCKHNIIANSSFSWWGAWLNENPEKVVIAPEKWLNNCEAKDICNKEWIRIGGEKL